MASGDPTAPPAPLQATDPEPATTHSELSPLPPPPPPPAAKGAAAGEPETGRATSAIEPATGPGEEDEFEPEEGYESATSSLAASTSVTSSIYAHTFENGRRYHHFKNGRYPIPNDDVEQNREELKHAMLLELTDGRLFYAPIGEHPQLILDIGTGTGTWAIEVGDQFPSAAVCGIDLSPIQPAWVPPNVSFLVDDCEEEWGHRHSEVDFVHFRFMMPILKNVGLVLERAFMALKPGGWIELQDLNCRVECDDDTMPDDDPVKVVYEFVDQAYAKFSMDIQLASKMQPLLAAAGFTDIRCIVRKVPIGAWARDKTMRLVGMYQRIAVQEIMPTFAGRPFKALGLSDAESQVRLALARRGMADTSVHRYFSYYFWHAQKPL